MRSKVLSLAFAVAVSAFAGLAAPVLTHAQARNAALGTWILDVAKSTFDGPGPQQQTRTFEDRGGGVTLVTVEGVNAQGHATFSQYAAKYDGKDYPMAQRGSATAGSIALKSVDAYTVTYTQKADGKVTATGTRTVSRDGKTLTITAEGKRPDGTTNKTVLVFDRAGGAATDSRRD